MNREEIVKEAEEHCNEVMCTVCKNNTCTERKIKCREWRNRRAGYYCGAEPREKRIAELEQENNKLLDVINNQDVKIADLEKENAELTERLEDLQEQNSEMFNTIALQEQQIEKLKADLNEAIEDANRWEETETFSVLNRIYNDNFEVITSVSN